MQPTAGYCYTQKEKLKAVSLMGSQDSTRRNLAFSIHNVDYWECNNAFATRWCYAGGELNRRNLFIQKRIVSLI
jgi:hypothetical protein